MISDKELSLQLTNPCVARRTDFATANSPGHNKNYLCKFTPAYEDPKYLFT